MRQLSSTAEQAIADIARRHGFSVGATHAMLDALVRGNGSMAQFSHPEFGGTGQWMRGGMTMVGNMFDNQLKAWVDALCQDLSNLLARRPEPPTAPGSAEPAPRGEERSSAAGSPGLVDPFVVPGARRADADWPGEYGTPNASGSQNGTRYAYFADARRLVIQRAGRTTVHDTGDHRIGGVSQQQPGSGAMTFTSQHGSVDLASLAVVSAIDPRSSDDAHTETALPAPIGASRPPARAQDAEAIFGAIERLAALKEKGIVSDAEFTDKKAELLRRV